MKIYQACDDEGGGSYFPSMGAALKQAREDSRYPDGGGSIVEVLEIEVVTGKAGILALANRSGWVAKSTVLCKLKNGRKLP